MLKVTINAQVYEAAKGKTIIQVADEIGVQIPRYCYHPDIGMNARSGDMLYPRAGWQETLAKPSCVKGQVAKSVVPRSQARAS